MRSARDRFGHTAILQCERDCIYCRAHHVRETVVDYVTSSQFVERHPILITEPHYNG